MTAGDESKIEKWGKLATDEGINRLLMEDTERGAGAAKGLLLG